MLFAIVLPVRVREEEALGQTVDGLAAAEPGTFALMVTVAVVE